MQALVLIMLLFLSPAIGLSEENQVQRLQGFYSALKDAEGSFVQKNRIKELGKTTLYKGYFYLKHNKMYLEYKGDNPHRIYLFDSTLIIYNEGNKTAFKMPFDERRYGQTPVAMLRGLADIKKEFNINATGEDRLVLKPLKSMTNIERVELKLSRDDGFPVESFVMIDSSGNTIDITFKNIRYNQGVSDRVFRFNPPQGATIVEN